MKTYQEFAIDYYQDEDGIFTARVPAIKGSDLSKLAQSQFPQFG